jgi:beta-glucanase (GH16 family)
LEGLDMNGRGQNRSKQIRLRDHGGPIAVIVLLAIVAGVAVYYLTASSPANATLHQAGVQRTAGAQDHLSSIHWTTVFDDNFSGKADSSLGPSWRFYTGTGIGIGQFVASSSVVHVDGQGHLVVGTIESPQGWLSGEVQTTHAYMPGPGQEMLVESRIELPAGGRGYWPAFWGLGVSALTNPKTEPMAGEDDFAETINNDPWVGQFMHCGISNRDGPCGLNTQVETPLSVPSGDSGWHVYSWLWCNKGSNSYVAFYIGNTLEMKVTEQQIGEKYWTLSFDHPYVFIYDLAIGGWASPPGPSTASSSSMKVDYLRIEIS